ncbi:MAG: heme o synthase [Gemmataceae bacterium]
MPSQVISTVEVAQKARASRVADYLALTRPKIGAMVLVTALLGMFLAGGEHPAWVVALMLVGTGLVSAGASTFNQFVERRTDARMKRTADRPLPSGRIGITQVVLFGVFLTVGGLVCLMLLPSGPAAAVVAGATFLLYVLAYTPAKRWTWWNTFIGAVPGAAPPLIGWAAARGGLGWESAPLFAILFFWQVPHFLAIAWIYRDDYRRAGLKMLPALDPRGIRTVRTMALNTLLLLAASLWPLAFGAGWLYAAGAVILAGAWLALVAKFHRGRTVRAARLMLWMSLVYLPLILLMLLGDRLM